MVPTAHPINSRGARTRESFRECVFPRSRDIDRLFPVEREWPYGGAIGRPLLCDQLQGLANRAGGGRHWGRLNRLPPFSFGRPKDTRVALPANKLNQFHSERRTSVGQCTGERPGSESPNSRFSPKLGARRSACRRTRTSGRPSRSPPSQVWSTRSAHAWSPIRDALESVPYIRGTDYVRRFYAAELSPT